jgi:hypothetical protein
MEFQTEHNLAIVSAAGCDLGRTGDLPMKKTSSAIE